MKKINLKQWILKISQWFSSGTNYQLLAEASPPSDSAYGGRLRIRGNAKAGVSGNQDTYWIGVDQFGNHFTGTQLNGASSITWNETITHLPRIRYDSLPSQSADTSTYFREWLAYFVSTGLFADGSHSRICMGMAWPNSQGTVFGQVYADAPVGGLPAYCSFVFVNLAGNVHYFGTYNGHYQFGTIPVTLSIQ